MAVRTLPTTRVGDAARLNKALDAMEALPIVVPPARCDTKFRDGRCIVNITCRKTHVQSSMKQPYVPLNNKDKSDPNAVATYDVAAEKLLALLETEHAACIANAKSEAERAKLTEWKEDKFTVTPKAGQREREKRQQEVVKRELGKAKPGAWGCVQARELWSTAEEVHLRPGHHWLFELGDDGNGSCVEKTVALGTRKWVDYKGVRFYHGESALVVKRWVHRIDDDAAGRTFADWDPLKDADPDQPAAAMIVNSSELRAAGFSLKELLPPELDAAARGVVSGRARGAGIRLL